MQKRSDPLTQQEDLSSMPVILMIDLYPEAMKGPGRRSLIRNEPILVQVHNDLSFGIWRENAERYGLQKGLTLPIDDPDHPFRGLIVIFVDVLGYFEQIGMEPFIAFAQLATVALDQARLKISVAAMASIDPLTNLLNLRALHEVINRVYAYAKRSAQPFGMILLDLDRFKMINDNYGHDIGDKILLGIGVLANPDICEDCKARVG